MCKYRSDSVAGDLAILQIGDMFDQLTGMRDANTRFLFMEHKLSET